MLSAGGTPAVLFYLLDRHALLAMTMGSKCVFLNSLTTPPRAPLQWRGTWYVPSRAKVPLCGGVARSTGVVIVVIVPHPVVQSMPPPKAVGITCTLHSNKKRGGAPFFLNTVCVYPTTISQQSRGHAFVAAQGVYDTACLGRVQIHNTYFVHVAFLDDDGVAIFHHTGRQ